MIRGVLLAFLFSMPQSLAADHVTLHLIPAPVRTDWTSPRTLASSALRSQLAPVRGGARHAIGHLFVEVECRGRFLMTGSTSIGSQDRDRVLSQAYGLGVLFETQPGKLEETPEVEKDLKGLNRTGRSSFLEFLISPETCDRLIRYLEEYRERGYDRIYGHLNSLPLKGESGGCTAFGMSFLELAGLQDAEFEKTWMQHLIVPKRLIGGPSTGERVPFARLLTDLESRWDSDLSHGGRKIDFWDPEKMVIWTRIALHDLKRGSPRVFPWPAFPSRRGRSEGIVFDAHLIPTPQGPIFRNH